MKFNGNRNIALGEVTLGEAHQFRRNGAAAEILR